MKSTNRVPRYWLDLDPYEVRGVDAQHGHEVRLTTYAGSDVEAGLRARRDYGKLHIMSIRAVGIPAKTAVEIGLIYGQAHDTVARKRCSRCSNEVAESNPSGHCSSCAGKLRHEREVRLAKQVAAQIAKHCTVCGTPVAKSNTKGLCLTCANQKRRGYTFVELNQMGKAS